MSDGIKQVILPRDGFGRVKERKFAARRVPDLKCSGIEVPRPGPQPIGTRSVAGAVHPVAPDAFPKINLLAGIDHGWICLGRVGPFDETGGHGRTGGRHVSGSRQNGKAPSHPEGDGDSRHNQRLFCQARKKSVHSRIP